jgi:hypothetical protein
MVAFVILLDKSDICVHFFILSPLLVRAKNNPNQFSNELLGT